MGMRAWLSARRRSPRHDVGAAALAATVIVAAAASMYLMVVAAVVLVGWLLRVAAQPRPGVATEAPPPPPGPATSPYRAVLAIDPKVGVPYAWLVDIEARVLTAHRLESGRWLTVGTYTDETEARIEPFDTVPLNIASWWPPGAPENTP